MSLLKRGWTVLATLVLLVLFLVVLHSPRTPFRRPGIALTVSRTMGTMHAQENTTDVPGNVTADVKTIHWATNLFGGRQAKYDFFFPFWSKGQTVRCEGGWRCRWTPKAAGADALVFHARELASANLTRLLVARRPAQRWVFFSWESIVHANVRLPPPWRRQFNWTATYMRHSHVWAPYFRGWRPLSPAERSTASRPPYDARAKMASPLAFAVISNCQPKGRQRFLRALRRRVAMDVFGRCGRRMAPGLDGVLALSRRYRFYLALENSRCRDYITEKFWANGARGQALPVVFGGLSRADYEAVAPPHSFIYAPSFPSVSALADFLKRLAANESAYAAYFEWKRRLAVDTYSMKEAVMCGLCRRLHTDRRPAVTDIGAFWNLSANCLSLEASMPP